MAVWLDNERRILYGDSVGLSFVGETKDGYMFVQLSSGDKYVLPYDTEEFELADQTSQERCAVKMVLKQ